MCVVWYELPGSVEKVCAVVALAALVLLTHLS